MAGLKERFQAFVNNRWLVFVAAMWMQSCTGPGYIFGSISPVIKSSLNYNQRQLSKLGVAKDLGGSVGIIAGSLSEILPLWGVLLVGALQNLIGYSSLWLIVTGKVPVFPPWAMCVLIFVGNNGETYFNTAALVSCVQNFPKSRGPVVGILKGFAALSGAILTQIYTMINFPDQASLIFMVAVGPTMVVFALMFIIRPVGGHKELRPSDGLSFTVVYSVCLLLAAYLMAIMLLEDLVSVSHNLITVLTLILFVPLFIPIVLSFCEEYRDPVEEVLLPKPYQHDAGNPEQDTREHEVVSSEFKDENHEEVDSLVVPEGQKRIAQLQAKLFQAAAEGAVRVKNRKGPHRGEDFTLMQALIEADFWLIMFSLLLGSGSGLTVIDNLGQMSQSLGYDNTHIFVSMICIWNFIGRVGGGYISEIIVRDHAYPRPIVIAMAQLVMAVGHVFFAMGWPGAMYIGTLLIGLCYGAHWAIMPATVSELFGLKKFGAFYNFLNLANPAGTLVFSGVIASRIYDREAEKQARQHRIQSHISGSIFSGMLAADESLNCEGSICFFLSSMIMSGFCMIAVVLSVILVYRTKTVYAHLYGKSCIRYQG
ncbi:protein NUCLEAR FUSION DEFECTIVE 4-like isoform X1 [Gossypium australe]|uniref:Protein NUCLEAR FUSION DEFECTIVE 4-like isoform X1 n=1 Tax=Gossypium australe TaxID=47621 RepID=A0A5B6UG26_9ROSI|nr:protein NUCLEAR FUSION DEFECTIVE 4-like isoform X1 [Gossypium australe]